MRQFNDIALDEINHVFEHGVATGDQKVAALLTLAWAVKSSGFADRRNAEEFGHEIALALKTVMHDAQLRIVNES